MKYTLGYSAVMLSVFGCNTPANVYLVSIRPACASDGLTHRADGSCPEVDTRRSFCLAIDGSCTPEPFFSHAAIITVRNDRVPDEDNPMMGRVKLTHYTTTYRSRGDGPELPLQQGRLNVTVEPDSEISFEVLLAGGAVKGLFDAADLPFPQPYDVGYEINGDRGIQLKGAVTVEFGNFDYCLADTVHVSRCP